MRLARALLVPGFVAAGVLLAGCEAEEDALYEQFNSADDLVEVDVGVDSPGEPRTLSLTSNTGQVVVGEASVSPGAVAPGEIVRVVVDVDPTWANIVDRVSVRVDSGARGVDEIDLLADSADEGLYVVELQAVGDPGEQRTDVFAIRLWDLVGDDDGEAADSGG